MEQNREQEQLFMLEYLVENIEIDTTKVPETLHHNIPHPPPLRVSVQFVNFDPLEVCQKELDESENMLSTPEKVVINFNSGKSLLFPMSVDDLRNNVINEPLYVVVFRKFGDDIHTVGFADIHVRKIWDDILKEIQCPCSEAQISRKQKGSYSLRSEEEGQEEVGKVTMFVRITCIGKSTFTQFQVFEERKCFLFKHSSDSQGAGDERSQNLYTTVGAENAMPEEVNVVTMALSDKAEDLDRSDDQDNTCTCNDFGMGSKQPSYKPATSSNVCPPCSSDTDSPEEFQYKMGEYGPKLPEPCSAKQPCICVTGSQKGKDFSDSSGEFHSAPQKPRNLPGKSGSGASKGFSFPSRDDYQSASGPCKAPQPCPCVTSSPGGDSDYSSKNTSKYTDSEFTSRYAHPHSRETPRYQTTESTGYSGYRADVETTREVKHTCSCSSSYKDSPGDSTKHRDGNGSVGKSIQSEEYSRSDGEMKTTDVPSTDVNIKGHTQSSPAIGSKSIGFSAKKHKQRKHPKMVAPGSYKLQKIETHTKCVVDPPRVPHDMGWQWKQEFIRKHLGRNYKPGYLRESVLKVMKNAVGESADAASAGKKKKRKGAGKKHGGPPTIKLTYHSGVYYVSMNTEPRKPNIKAGEDEAEANDPVKVRFFKSGEDEDELSEMSDFEVEFTPPGPDDEEGVLMEDFLETVTRGTQYLESDLPPGVGTAKSDGKGKKKKK